MKSVTQECVQDIHALTSANTPSFDEPPVYFGENPVDRDMVRFVVGVTLAALFILLGLLRPPKTILTGQSQFLHETKMVHAQSSYELIQHLKDLGLWDLQPDSKIPAVVFSGFPADFDTLNLGAQKKAFLHTLLPIAMVALAEVEQERATLLMIVQKLGTFQLDLFGAEQQSGWQDRLSQDDIYFLQQLGRKYRATKVSQLLNRVNVVPVSLILAQGALESSWGSSRFVSEGNNVFGVWTWGQEGLVPARRDNGKKHKIAVYDSILESVRSYVLMLNRVGAYRQLRWIRRQTMDSLTLANGLLLYSEKRQQYVEDIRRVIEANGLRKYDQYVLGVPHQTTWAGTADLARL